MRESELYSHPHRRKNILTGEWLLVSPQRTKRPWQGEVSPNAERRRPSYDPECYLCPGNARAGGVRNPAYTGTYVFTNDFPALLPDIPTSSGKRSDLLVAKSERGTCRVVNFSPRHDLTLAEMNDVEIANVITIWQQEFASLGSMEHINSVQIFENKGAIMGNSNPHPHCQIWAQESVPMECRKEGRQLKAFFSKAKRSLLERYLAEELKSGERIVHENSSFVCLVPFWAVWPYETMILPRKKRSNILELTEPEKQGFAEALRTVTGKYDNLFGVSFPYSSGLHQAPTDGRKHPEWHFHMHFYPPLLRSATVKKYMVGYEMLAEPQRDITAEQAAKILKGLPGSHPVAG